MNKINIPITILISSIIIGGFYYASEIGKQKIMMTEEAGERKLNEEKSRQNQIMLKQCLDKIDTGLNDYRQQDQDLCFKLYPINY